MFKRIEMDRSCCERIYPLQKYLYMLLKSIDLEMQDDPLTKFQMKIIVEHLEYALVTGYEKGITSLKQTEGTSLPQVTQPELETLFSKMV